MTRWTRPHNVSVPADLSAAYAAALLAGHVPAVATLLQDAMRAALEEAGYDVPAAPAPPRTAAATAARWGRERGPGDRYGTEAAQQRQRAATLRQGGAHAEALHADGIAERLERMAGGPSKKKRRHPKKES